MVCIQIFDILSEVIIQHPGYESFQHFEKLGNSLTTIKTSVQTKVGINKLLRLDSPSFIQFFEIHEVTAFINCTNDKIELYLNKMTIFYVH